MKNARNFLITTRQPRKNTLTTTTRSLELIHINAFIVSFARRRVGVSAQIANRAAPCGSSHVRRLRARYLRVSVTRARADRTPVRILPEPLARAGSDNKHVAGTSPPSLWRPVSENEPTARRNGRGEKNALRRTCVSDYPPMRGAQHPRRELTWLFYEAAAFSTSCCSSPDWYISIMMSQPPRNSPSMYSCGIVGQLEYLRRERRRRDDTRSARAKGTGGCACARELLAAAARRTA